MIKIYDKVICKMDVVVMLLTKAQRTIITSRKQIKMLTAESNRVQLTFEFQM